MVILIVETIEKLISTGYQLISNSGLAEDTTQKYINRIKTAQASVPEPKVG